MKKLILASFLVIISSLTLKAQWTTSGTYIYNTNTGNVGIGTSTITAPTTPLHIYGSLNGELTLQIQNNYSGGARTFLSSDIGKSRLSTDMDFAISTNGGGWSDKFIFTNAGKFGIGTTSPGSLFTIQGTGGLGSTFQQKITNGSQTLAFGANATAAEIQSQGAVPLYLNYGGNNVIMSHATTNVGIGTNTPSGKLHITGNSGWDTSTKVYITNGSSDYGRTNLILTGRMQAGNDAWNFGTAGRNSIVFSSNYSASGQNIGSIGTEQFSIQHEQASNSLGFLSQTKGQSPLLVLTQAGDVGIGTPSPRSPLEVRVAGNNSSVQTGLTVQQTNPSNPNNSAGVSLDFGIGNNTSNNNVMAKITVKETYWGVKPKMIFSLWDENNNWSDRMVIDTQGNVGIGTSSTGSFKLAVEGKIGAREVNVTLANPWPDYVFENGYKLPSLPELEQYIMTNKHLPEVPSAEQVKENGLSVGEMNAILLKKVEELTLHLIEQNNKIENLQKEVRELKIQK